MAAWPLGRLRWINLKIKPAYASNLQAGMGSAWSQGRIVLATHPCPLRRVADLSRICVETFLKEERM